MIFPQSLVTMGWLKLLLREQIHEDLKVGMCGGALSLIMQI